MGTNNEQSLYGAYSVNMRLAINAHVLITPKLFEYAYVLLTASFYIFYDRCY